MLFFNLTLNKLQIVYSQVGVMFLNVGSLLSSVWIFCLSMQVLRQSLLGSKQMQQLALLSCSCGYILIYRSHVFASLPVPLVLVTLLIQKCNDFSLGKNHLSTRRHSLFGASCLKRPLKPSGALMRYLAFDYLGLQWITYIARASIGIKRNANIISYPLNK